MNSIRVFLSKEKSIGWILVFGAVLRLLFLFLGGAIYYGRADYFAQGDTSSWFQSFINLYQHGTFTVDLAVDAGKYFRPPGYSFLYGIFYLLSFENEALAWKLLVGAQVLMDVASIYFISKITGNTVKNSANQEKALLANCAALLYAAYPFVITWAPVLYAETSSIFFLLLSVHFAFGKVNYRSAFLSGIFGGIATLIRLQCAFGILFIAATFFFTDNKTIYRNIRYVSVFCFALLITYGLWPARNYFLHGRVLFSQDLNMGKHWSPGFMSFLDFAHSISTDHTTYYFQILKNEKVDWPRAAYLEPGDSALLDSAVNMCRTCSNGFAYWKWGERISPALELHSPGCDSTLGIIFHTLYERQKSKNAFHYWVTIPTKNLEKCFFKISLKADKGTVIGLIANLLFIFRSVLLLTGLLGLYLAFRNDIFQRKLLVFISCYMATWYFYLSVFYRNMEMRYLLHTDILLLIPAAYALILIFFSKRQQGT